MSYEFRSLNVQSLAYDAATNTPPLSALANGGMYKVAVQGRVAATTVAGAQDGADAVLLAGDWVQMLDGALSLATADVAQSQNVDVGVGGTALFAAQKEAMAYLRQRNFDAGVAITMNLLASYAGVEAGTVDYAHPQASQIEVAGIAVSENISACTGVTGSIGNLAVSYTLGAAITGLAIGDVVIIDQETTDDPQATLFLGSHCGTWKVSAVSGTAVTVQNIQKMKTTLTPANFASARMTKVTQVNEQGNFSNAVRMTVGNVAFFHDLNKYVFYGKNGSILVKGFLGVGSTSASANTTQVTLTEEFDVLSATYQAINVAGTTYTMGLNSVFAPNSGKSSIQAASGQGGAVTAGDINVETLLCGTSPIDVDLQASVTCKNKFGAYYSEGGELFAYVDATCNVNSVGGNYITAGSMFFVTQTACNGNTIYGNIARNGDAYIGTQTSCSNNAGAVGNAVGNGSFLIDTQVACNNNAGGNQVSGSGCMTILTQTACNSNTVYANHALAGNLYIGTQTACNLNVTGNNVDGGRIKITTQTDCSNNTSYGNYAQAGEIYIVTQNGCTGNTTQNNYATRGVISIEVGASTTTGAVGVALGGGLVVKQGGTSPFTVTDAPVPTGYAVDTTLTKFNYFSIATANNVDFTLPLASTVQSGVYYTIQNGGSYTGVTVAPNAADTIDGSASAITLLSRENIVLTVTAANSWSVLSNESSVVPPVVPVTLSGTATVGVGQTNVGIGANATALTMPILSSTVLGTLYTIKNFNYTSVTYIVNAADLLDGNAPAAITLAPQESVVLQAYSATTWATV